jgi:hypothetical protein
VFQIVDFSSINDLKFIYMHLQFQKFFLELYSRTPMMKAKAGKGGEGREGREEKGGMGWGEPPENKSWLYGPDSDYRPLA